MGTDRPAGIVAVNIDVMVNGRPWKVAMGSTNPGAEAAKITVTIKGQSRAIDAFWIDDVTLSLIDRGTAREIRIHPRSDNVIGVEVDGRLFEAIVALGDGRLQPPPSDAATVQPAAGLAAAGRGVRHAIKAPMPGRVVRVLVAVGAQVTARQPVVVMEAMKMENELRAPADGTVQEIAVAAGTAVEGGAVLIVIGD